MNIKQKFLRANQVIISCNSKHYKMMFKYLYLILNSTDHFIDEFVLLDQIERSLDKHQLKWSESKYSTILYRDTRY